MSSKTVAQKLLILPDTTIWSSHVDRLGMVEPMPDGVHVTGDLGQASIGLAFSDDAASLRDILDTHKASLTALSILWVVYPQGKPGRHQPG